ncbi:MAG: neocarzinostatin apoprotein domain-containing protein [Acidimicrobiales bacterium]
MILLVVIVVLLAAGAAAGLLGGGFLSGKRSGLAAWLSAPVVLVGGVVLLAVVFLGVGGLPGSGPAPEPASTTTPPRTDTTPALPFARLAEVTADIPVIRIEPATQDRFSPYRPVSGLTPGSVVRVVAEGFDWHERGRVEQCVSELGRQTACAEAFPVQFDDDGRADFQFAVRGDFAPGGCRAGQPTCLLRLRGESSGRRGTVQTVLVDEVTPGRVSVEPGRGLVDGQTVDVSVSGFLPGTTASAVLCAPPEAYDARRCTSPGPTSAMVIDAAGLGHTTLTVAAGRTGPDGVVCGPRRPCGVAVVVGPGFVAAAAAPVGFSLGPGAAYDVGRVAGGLGCALLLVALAVVIGMRTDWTRPAEAATPALDGADLRADQDLDQLFGTDEEIDERDPIES